MEQKYIIRLEAQLENLVERAFANLFGKRVRARDIALQLTRAMDANVRIIQASDTIWYAPDMYIIYLHPELVHKLLEQEPQLPQILTNHLVELTRVFDYKLSKSPVVQIVAKPQLSTRQVEVVANHTDHNKPDSTSVMSRVEVPDDASSIHAQLILGDGQSVELTGDVVNIGRDISNHIVVDDPYVSRHHVQLRQRNGTYLLFDIDSNSGTYVNQTRVREHHLQAGDVIRLGRTQLVYLAQMSSSQGEGGETQSIEPHSPEG
jgi:hypothetical protein